MSNVIIDDNKNCYDFNEVYDCYKYLVMRMQKYGAPSDELALLGKLYRDAEATPEMVDGMIKEYFLTGKLLDETLEYYNDMQSLEPDNLSLPKFHEAMQKLNEKRGFTNVSKNDGHRHELLVSQKNAPECEAQLYFISYSFWRYTYDDSKPEGDTVEGFGNTVEDCHIERFEDVEAIEDKLRKRLEYDGLTIINYIKIN